MSDFQVMSLEDIQKLRVVDLKEKLKSLNESTSGLKADLIERLHNAMVRLSENNTSSNNPTLISQPYSGGPSATEYTQPYSINFAGQSQHDFGLQSNDFQGGQFGPQTSLDIAGQSNPCFGYPSFGFPSETSMNFSEYIPPPTIEGSAEHLLPQFDIPQQNCSYPANATTDADVGQLDEIVEKAEQLKQEELHQTPSMDKVQQQEPEEVQVCNVIDEANATSKDAEQEIGNTDCYPKSEDFVVPQLTQQPQEPQQETAVAADVEKVPAEGKEEQHEEPISDKTSTTTCPFEFSTEVKEESSSPIKYLLNTLENTIPRGEETSEVVNDANTDDQSTSVFNDSVEVKEKEALPPPVVKIVSNALVEEDSITMQSTSSTGKLTKAQKKKLRKKQKRKEKNKGQENTEPRASESDSEEKPEVEVEYVPQVDKDLESDPLYYQFSKIFEKFRSGDTRRLEDQVPEEPMDDWKKLVERKKPVELDLKGEDNEDQYEDGETTEKLSKRKMKLLTRMSVAELKKKVDHPELVEMHDVTAKDPFTLILLKSTRNTVPVPRHWCFKRKYLQGKRGFEKPPFKLPEFIRRTGIMEMREAVLEKDDAKSLKTKMREKMRPKMGKIDIDYQKLHDAFFRWQTKPPMTGLGDLYYEGKEFETVHKDKKPGELSNELRTALGMPIGPNCNKVPPPWLIAMQRYGPPPSYPNQKIPGLNAPIPEGCAFGYQAGGWGKPPVDEYGRPLYGDVFGLNLGNKDKTKDQEEVVDKSLWGEIDEETSDEESEEEEEDEDKDDEDVDEEAGTSDSRVEPSGLVTPSEGLITPGGYASSIPAGLETPGLIELRKRRIEEEMEMRDNPALYQVLSEKKTERLGSSMMASTFVYDVGSSGTKKRKLGSDGQVYDVALDPSELDLNPEQIQSRLQEKIQESSNTRSQLTKDPELSDMVSRHIQETQKKKNKPTDDNKKKKYKDFKF